MKFKSNYSQTRLLILLMVVILVTIISTSSSSFDLEDTREIGYEFLNDGAVVHIWNNATISDYFFDVDSGIQLTNHYEDYWTRNIFCIGYYDLGTWHKIKCADELSNFNKNIETDNLTYVNATLWKDINYGAYDLRLGVQYHLGLNDENLSITIYGKNLGIDIPYDLGFAWKIKDVNIPNHTDKTQQYGDSIEINRERYALNETMNLSFTNLSYTYYSEHQAKNITKPNTQIRLQAWTEYLRLNWNENLNYEVKVYGNGVQEDFYTILMINAGHFNPQQEKSTTMQWIDAYGDYISSFNISGESASSRGITTDGTNIWVIDNGASAIYKYDMLGNNIGAGTIDTSGEMSFEYGIATNGTTLFAVDYTFVSVYTYDFSGNYVSSWSLNESNQNPTGITSDGINIWVLDVNDDEVYKYTMTGTYVDSFDISVEVVQGYGITTNGSNIFVHDFNDEVTMTIYSYNLSGTYIVTQDIDISSEVSFITGLATNTTNMFAVDNDLDMVYIYELNDVSEPYPVLSFLYPTNTSYNYNVVDINYSSTGESCWYSLDQGATNGSAVACGINWTGLSSSEGDNNWILYANNTAGDDNLTDIDFVKSTATNITACGSLDIANNNYTQIQDIIPTADENCIIIGADNITYDCNSYYIGNSTNDNVAIYVNQSIGVIVKNCNVSMSYSDGYGIQLFGSNNSHVLNNTANNNRYGIYLNSNSSNNVLMNNTINDNSLYGIYHLNSNNNNLTNNTANDNDFFGINLDSGSGNVLLNNTLNSNKYSGIYVWSGLANNLTSNTASNNAIGIYLQWKSNNNILTRNTVSDNDCGIYFHLGSNNILTNNIVNLNNDYGIYLHLGSNNNILTNNIVNLNNNHGIYFSGSSNNILTNNTVNNNNYGLYISFLSSNNNITDSTISGSISSDVSLDDGSIDNIFLNTSYSSEFVEATSELIRKWYFSTNVTDSSSSPIQNVNVTGYNNLDTQVFSKLTDAGGGIVRRELVDYINNGTKTYYTPHNITITGVGWITNSTLYNLTEDYNIFHSVTLFPYVTVDIDYPKAQIYSYNHTLELNYTITNITVLDKCWFYILNSSNGYEISNTTLTNCANTTFNISQSDIYTLHLFANETTSLWNNPGTDSVIFLVSLDNPAVVLDYPTDNLYNDNGTNIYFNFTTTDDDGVDECQLWGNWTTGGWHKNYTWLAPTTGLQNYTILNLTDGRYKWNVFCNDTTNAKSWALNNFTSIIDTIFPIINFTTANDTAVDSRVINILYNITDINLDICYFTLRDSSGNVHNYGENTSISCSSSRAISTLSYGTFTFQLYGKDLASNLESNSLTFTTRDVSVGEVGGGAGPVIIIGENATWSCMTDTGGRSYVFVMSKGESRTKEVRFINYGDEELVIDIECEDIVGGLCSYVSLNKTTVVLPPSPELETSIEFTLQLPEVIQDAIYDFNIKGTAKVDGSIGKVSVRARVGEYGIFGWLLSKIIGRTMMNLSWINDSLAQFEVFNFFILLLPYVMLVPILYFGILRKVKIKFPLALGIPFIVSFLLLFIVH